MMNNGKIYPAKIGFAADWESFKNSAKDFFNLLPSAKTLSLFGFCAFCLLIFQVFLVGVFDRFGVSPKVAILVSSAFYVAAFAGLAMVGGLRKEAIVETQPICKMLIIKRKI